ncbi:sugar ABC transporter substrate-binding protein [Candidatus Neomarinimicrobiota bacterium]
MKHKFGPALPLLIGLMGCGDAPQIEAEIGLLSREEIRIIVVTHGQASDPFWSVVKNGVDAAARDMRVQVEYQAPNSFDMVGMAQLIDAAVAARPQGLIVSIPDADALQQSLKDAIGAGIPAISINAGGEYSKQFGMLTHIGQSAYATGYKAGERMAAAGVTKGICMNHEVGNQHLDFRCQGFADALRKSNGGVTVLAVNLADPVETQQRLTAALTSNSEVNGILSLGPTSVLPALKSLEELNLQEDIRLATFDLSPAILNAIEDGRIIFAIDQQQYLQGYLPVVLLTLYITNLNSPAYDQLNTGPGFVTQENAADIILLTRQGTH